MVKYFSDIRLTSFCDKIRAKIVLHIERSCCFKLKIFNPTTMFPIAVFSIFLPISPLASASRSHTAATQHLHLKPLHHSPPLLEATVQRLTPSEAFTPQLSSTWCLGHRCMPHHAAWVMHVPRSPLHAAAHQNFGAYLPQIERVSSCPNCLPQLTSANQTPPCPNHLHAADREEFNPV